MTAATSRLRRRGIGAGVAALVGLTTVGFSATSAFAAPNFEITRPAQTGDRFQTAASVALAAFPDGAENVIIANGDNAVDALAASVLAGTDIPILYVTSNEIPASTQAALDQLDPSTSWIVGGSAAVSAAVEGELPGAIERIDGATRYETAAALAQAVVDGADEAPTSAFIARGDDFADALAIAPAAAKSGTPVLLTETGTLSEAAAAFLADNDITDVTVLGGTAAVSDAVVEELEANDVTVTRIRGANRQATAVDIANTEAFGFSNTGVALVNGWRPVDALPASVWAAQQNFPIILTAGAELGAEAQGYLAANAETLVTGFAVGGTGVIPESVVASAEQAAGAVAEPEPTTNQTFVVEPPDAATVTDDDTASTGTTDQRQYVITNPVAGAQHRIVLFNADEVTVDANGVVTFLDEAENDGDGNNDADTGAVASRITVVNGSTVAGGAGDVQVEVAPVNGQISFTVEGNGFESVIPVVYADANSDNNLDLDDDGATTEDFGVGGVLNVLPTEAATGALAGTAQILDVNKDANYIVADLNGVDPAGLAVLNYGSDGDRFFVDAPGVDPAADAPENQVNLEDFEASLTEGDALIVPTTYSRNFASTFVVLNQEPNPLNGLTAGDRTDTTIEFGVRDVNEDATVRIYALQDELGDESFDDAAVVAEASADADEDTESVFDIAVSGLNADTPYVFWATQVVDGEESAPTAAVTARTLTEGEVSTLVAENSVVVNAGDLLGNTADGDLWQIGFNRPLDPSVQDGAALAVQDADGAQAVISDSAESPFTLNAAEVSFEGETYAPGELLTVELAGGLEGLVGGERNPLNYPLEIINSSGVTAGAGDYAWSLTDSADITLNIDRDADAVPTDQAAPGAPTVTPPADTVVNADTVTIAGTAESGATLTVFRSAEDGTAVVGATATAGPDGNYSIAGVPLNQDAVNTFFIESVDPSGNVSPRTAVPAITEDSTAPAPTIAALTNGALSVTVDFSEAVIGDLAADEIAISDAADDGNPDTAAPGVGTVTRVDENTFTFAVTGEALATDDTVTVNAGAVVDAADNGNTSATGTVS
ncbi:cell wall-binding repeat-containing protein [Kineococcus arenarius]|uniref:cell wall-binding repeat-containing protein n=1 Tax=unclassified Kineococcus TaxID=2621656 RepID=UPI003D7EEE07